ncbi:plant cysteine oxidase 2-like [Canna indica]|uniref:cysteine dioxygenase n=1 Tax=Canna indica TaxID=4628 RepID=A0AAQ3KA61_9LILI|nr:plant cysteine oxidase 2-like [Canna indica]
MKVEARYGEEEEERLEKRPGAKRNGERLLRKRGCSRRTRRRVQPASSAIQRLFLACKTVFKGGSGTVPEPADVEMLHLLLDKMKPEDIGLSTDMLLRVRSPPKGTPRITYAVIYKCDNFSICIFILPPRAVIPLHNHPGMTVFSKLLLGSMHIKSYDWLDPVPIDNSAPSAKLRAAKLVMDSDFTSPCDTSILYPTTGGNIHTFTAITPCAILDVQGPPYSKEEDRDITYYQDLPYLKYPNGVLDQIEGADQCLGWLEEVDMSKDLKMDVVPYLGPQVIDV